MKIIGTGVGRTGTYSLKLAINQLGYGPCHHMEEVLHKMPIQVPLWVSAVKGEPNWSAMYDGYRSAVDWPTAGFFRELYQAFPNAKFVHTERSPESWADSFGSTIYTLLKGRAEAPPEMHDWLDMAVSVIAKTGFPEGLDRQGLIDAFNAHNEAVREAIPEESLLIFEVKQGWQPLCDFLGVAVPSGDFPRSNDRAEFWDRVNGNL